MADLRIVDAPVLLQESITDDVKMPTGGLGNYAIRLGDLVWYVVAKENLASKSYVDTSSKGVQDKLDSHIANKNNPHQVTKQQVGLGNVDNTADIDKPVSNAVSSAIITATTDMATKDYVNQKDNLKADKATTLNGYGITDAYTQGETYNRNEIDDVLSLKSSVAYVDGKVGDLTTLSTTEKTALVKAINEIHGNTADVVLLYDRNVTEGAGVNGWSDQLVALSGGRTQRDKNSDFVTAKDYGAIQDGTLHTLAEKYATLVDAQAKYPFATSLNDSIDWAAIQLAINSRPYKAFFITNGESVINKKLIMTKPVHIIGDFENSTVYYTSDITDAVLSYEPDETGSRNAMVSRLHVLPHNSQAANTASAFRSVSATDKGLNHLVIQNCDFRALGGGYAINLINDDANLNNDGTALVLIDTNTLVGGIKAPNLGDSCVIKYNNIKGKNVGIDASLVNGAYASASSLIIEKNNIVNDNGAIRLKNIRNTHVLHNNIEQLAALNLADDRHAIEIDGDLDNSYSTVMFNKIEPSDPNKYCGGIKISNLQAGAVKFNAIGTSAVLDGDFNPIGRTDAIKIINSRNVDVGKNTLYISSGCNGIYVDNTSVEITGVEDQRFKFYSETNSTKIISDSKRALVWQSVATDIITAYDTNNTTLQAKIKDGIVYLQGKIKSSGLAYLPPSSIIGLLPSNTLPNNEVYFSVEYMDTGGALSSRVLMISKSGEIVTRTQFTNIEFISISFSYAL